MARIVTHLDTVTRGRGRLEAFLARQRARMANKLVPPELRAGRILDVGCGKQAYFLARTEFAKKYGVDKLIDDSSKKRSQVRREGVTLAHFDVDANNRLPFAPETFDVVTMLAVVEHRRDDRLIVLLNEIDRVLRPGGAFIMTTPAGWTAPILTIMKWLQLVSAEEIDEHKHAYTRGDIGRLLCRTRLADYPTRIGAFECFMNTWALIGKRDKATMHLKTTDGQRSQPNRKATRSKAATRA